MLEFEGKKPFKVGEVSRAGSVWEPLLRPSRGPHYDGLMERAADCGRIIALNTVDRSAAEAIGADLSADLQPGQKQAFDFGFARGVDVELNTPHEMRTA